MLGNMELVRHGDAAAGSLEERCGREDCRRVVAVRIKLVDASLGDILAGWWITGLLSEETSIYRSQSRRSNGV